MVNLAVNRDLMTSFGTSCRSWAIRVRSRPGYPTPVAYGNPTLPTQPTWPIHKPSSLYETWTLQCLEFRTS